MKDRTDYICNFCNKIYSSYKSRWLHINKYHTKSDISQNKSIDKPNISQNKSFDKSNISQNKSIDKSQIDDKYECKFCNKSYKHFQSRWKHEQKCKVENNKIENSKLEKLEKEINEIKQQNKELKEILKSLKIHPKTLQKINNQLNNTNNGTINNITIIPLGKENLSELLTEKEKLNVLSTYGNCVTELVKLVHVSDKDKYKPYKNIYITNLQNNIAYKYDDKKKKFIAVTKSELLETIINNRIGDIEEFYHDYKDKITPFTSKQIDSFLKKIDNEKEYKDVKKDDIKLAIYNGREEIINQIKENNPELNLFT